MATEMKRYALKPHTGAFSVWVPPPGKVKLLTSEHGRPVMYIEAECTSTKATKKGDPPTLVFAEETIRLHCEFVDKGAEAPAFKDGGKKFTAKHVGTVDPCGGHIVMDLYVWATDVTAPIEVKPPPEPVAEPEQEE